jgi:DNA-binding beta-propeller fold protein YncE
MALRTKLVAPVPRVKFAARGIASGGPFRHLAAMDRVRALLRCMLGLAAAPLLASPGPLRMLPGLQSDGSTLLHNQWSIRPAGRQVELGNFPTALAVHPDGHWAAVLHCGDGPHEVRIVDLSTGAITATAAVNEAFYGIAFSGDGRTLVCSGASDEVLHVFDFHEGRLAARPDVVLAPRTATAVPAGFALSRNAKTAIVACLWGQRVMRVDLAAHHVVWDVSLALRPPAGTAASLVAPPPADDWNGPTRLDDNVLPYAVAWDAQHHRVFVSLWGSSAIAVLSDRDGSIQARWPAGDRPGELLLSPDRRLFAVNSIRNTVTVLDARDGRMLETLSVALAAGDLPGVTPESLALSPDGRTLFVANAGSNAVAVFDVTKPGHSRALGLIPTGWMPTAVRLTPDGGRLLVVSARGLAPHANPRGPQPGAPRTSAPQNIAQLYRGSLGVVALPRGAALSGALARWTADVLAGRPVAARDETPSAVPRLAGASTPLDHVIYIIKENRTYDQVLGDLPQGNGDPALCLFPEKITPNHHALAREFVLLDNFYANAEVSASGHEWSMAAYATEFVEKDWPISYRGGLTKFKYPSEGRFVAAVPANGYLWDRAAATGISYRSYGEFTTNGRTPADPATTTTPALRGHIDEYYRGWDLGYPDARRADRFIAELHRFDAAGEMPRLQIVRLPSDHTEGTLPGSRTPRAMVADNDLALGRLVEAVSRSRFWPRTVIFVVEDDAQNGPDHVDAHRTVALVISPYVRRGAVDSTPYTTCSMLHTIELLLGLAPMSLFDETATPMRMSFRDQPDLTPYTARPANVDLEERNTEKSPLAATSRRLDFSKEDAADEQALNRAVWASVRGSGSIMPAPVHAVFVRPLVPADADDD